MERIAVVFGGRSNEYTVSLRSCESLLNNLDPNRFEVLKVGITREGSWLLTDATPAEIRADGWQEKGVPAVISPDAQHQGLLVLKEDGWKLIGLDCIFPAVHGQNCEDGNLQGLLTLSGIPYVGCHTASSAICFDKEFTHIVAEAAGIPMAKYMAVRRRELLDNGEDSLEAQLAAHIGYPMFIKPCNSGSSVGVSRAESKEQLLIALSEAFAHDDKVVVEEMIRGFEVECAVLGNDTTIAPVVGQVISADGFYDFDAKYVNSTAEIVIPARISEEQSQAVRKMAIEIFRMLDCKGYARVDFFVTDKGVVFNEINNLPGFTSISMYPQMMIYSGIPYTELLSKLIDLAKEATN